MATLLKVLALCFACCFTFAAEAETRPAIMLARHEDDGLSPKDLFVLLDKHAFPQVTSIGKHLPEDRIEQLADLVDNSELKRAGYFTKFYPVVVVAGKCSMSVSNRAAGLVTTN